MTHSELVEKAAAWLRQRCPVVITEMASAASEEADVIGFNGYQSILIECKISLNDYDLDKAKPYRRYPETGMGDIRYYFTVGNLLNPKRLPDNWGLLEIHGKRVYTKKKPVRFLKKAVRGEQALLISTIRRIGQAAPKGVSVRCYTNETKNRASVHIDIEPLE